MYTTLLNRYTRRGGSTGVRSPRPHSRLGRGKPLPITRPLDAFGASDPFPTQLSPLSVLSGSAPVYTVYKTAENGNSHEQNKGECIRLLLYETFIGSTCRQSTLCARCFYKLLPLFCYWPNINTIFASISRPIIPVYTCVHKGPCSTRAPPCWPTVRLILHLKVLAQQPYMYDVCIHGLSFIHEVSH